MRAEGLTKGDTCQTYKYYNTPDISRDTIIHAMFSSYLYHYILVGSMYICILAAKLNTYPLSAPLPQETTL